MDDIFATLVDDVMGPETHDTEEPATFEERYEDFSNKVREHILGLGPVRLEQIQRDSEQRFSTSLPLNKVHDTTVALVGAGGLGNWIWRVIIGMGFKRLHIFDDDVVGVENIGPQAHRLIDLDLPKVEAIRREALAFRGVEIYAHNMRVRSLDDIINEVGTMPDILIGATDSAEFRNSIINGFGTRGMHRTLDLFLDLRMSLGDWNAFAFTPKALVTMGYFDESEDGPYMIYKRQAVFDPSEAVAEPCTARAITYTGANVASYVGAFLHWWIKEGRDKVNTDAGFLLNSFYCDDRDGANFNWLYRNSSKEFDPVTISVKQRERNEDAGLFRGMKHAVSNMMNKTWGGLYRRTFSQFGMNDGTVGMLPEAWLDIDGEMHLFKMYRDVCTQRSVAIDINLERSMATMLSEVWNNEGEADIVEERMSERISANRVHVEYLSSSCAAGKLFSDSGGVLMAEDGVPGTVVSGLIGRSTGGDLTMVMRLTFAGRDDDLCTQKFRVSLFLKNDENIVKSSTRVLASVLKTIDDSEVVFMSGMRELPLDNETAMSFWADEGVPLTTVIRYRMDNDSPFLRALFNPEVPATKPLSSFGDGTLVEVKGYEGVFEKRSDAGRPYLWDREHELEVDVPRDMVATEIEALTI